MVIDIDVDVVVNVGQSVVRGGKTNGETTGIPFALFPLLSESNGRGRKIINDPIVVVSVLDVQLELGCLQLTQGDLTEL